MFHRIDMNLIYMSSQIRIIMYLMLPIPALPYPAFAFPSAGIIDVFAFLQRTRETGLDKGPAQRVVGISGWQCPDGVQMVG